MSPSIWHTRRRNYVRILLLDFVSRAFKLALFSREPDFYILVEIAFHTLMFKLPIMSTDVYQILDYIINKPYLASIVSCNNCVIDNSSAPFSRYMFAKRYQRDNKIIVQ